MECEWKKIKLLSLFFTFKGLRHVKTLKNFFQRGYSVASQTSNKTFFEKKKNMFN